MKEEAELKRFLNHINNLSPWNLWSPGTWSKNVEEREISPAVIAMIKKIKLK